MIDDREPTANVNGSQGSVIHGRQVRAETNGRIGAESLTEKTESVAAVSHR